MGCWWLVRKGEIRVRSMMGSIGAFAWCFGRFDIPMLCRALFWTCGVSGRGMNRLLFTFSSPRDSTGTHEQAIGNRKQFQESPPPHMHQRLARKKQGT